MEKLGCKSPTLIFDNINHIIMIKRIYLRQFLLILLLHELHNENTNAISFYWNSCKTINKKVPSDIETLLWVVITHKEMLSQVLTWVIVLLRYKIYVWQMIRVIYKFCSSTNAFCLLLPILSRMFRLEISNISTLWVTSLWFPMKNVQGVNSLIMLYHGSHISYN